MSNDEFWKNDERKLREIKKNVQQVIFSRQESGIPHNPYEQEKREMDSIRRGDREMLERSHKETYRGEVGRLADNDLRHVKNIGICVIVLASRAAIEGGVLPEEAFSMADGYILEIEKMTDMATVTMAARRAEYEFLDRVKQSHTEKETNALIERTKNFIFQNIHHEIRIGEIGHQLGVSQTYLSDLFHRVEGMTIQQYIRREKIRLAENMLRYSEYGIKEIASYLSFCSQSHFGKAFKEQTGMTPTRYREVFGRFSKNENT